LRRPNVTGAVSGTVRRQTGERGALQGRDESRGPGQRLVAAWAPCGQTRRPDAERPRPGAGAGSRPPLRGDAARQRPAPARGPACRGSAAADPEGSRPANRCGHGASARPPGPMSARLDAALAELAAAIRAEVRAELASAPTAPDRLLSVDE